MGRTPMSGGTAFRFMPQEVTAMEKALEEAAGATPARSVVEGLAQQFTNSPERLGQRAVAWKQVWNWFQNRRHAQKAKIEKSKGVATGGGETPPPAPKAAAVAGTSTPKKAEVPMDFEAKSARDGAWYDVSAFIEKRNLDTDHPEVKVRFAGFGSEEDEWVNISTAVRQRSLPCETTECVAVLPGDLILCFQEGSEQALYFDADILDVQRRRHDVRGCRCRFWVRYRHDQTEEVVPLRKVCRRPETEQRLQLARDGSGASLKLSKDIGLDAMRALGSPQIPSNLKSASQVTPATPSTPATPAQGSSAFNAAHNLYTGTASNLYTPVQQGMSTLGLQPMQPMITPDARQQAVPSSAASIHSTGVVQGAAVSSSQGPPSTPLGTLSAITQQQNVPSIESSITRQLKISAPVQQAPPSTANVGTTQAMEGVSLTPAVDPAGPYSAAQGSASAEVAKSSAPGPASTVGTAQTSNLAQSMEGVSSTPAVDPAGPSGAAQGSCSAEVGEPTPVDEPTRVGDDAVAPASAP